MARFVDRAMRARDVPKLESERLLDIGLTSVS